ncbi:NAD-dependent epimerase [Oleispirillum naphthae]|uniref:NAD-dependent epimerase n=1 Tax=Oleispirillum naphthae TaxID=2838853 RepID=UPI0030822E30
MTVLVTGAAGFIGFHTCLRLLEAGRQVVGIDNRNAYYDPALKQARADILAAREGYTDVIGNIANLDMLKSVFAEHAPEVVINLAAQAGVRYSVENPFSYVSSNLVGFVNILECCRHGGVKHLVYASTSSVFGANAEMPFAESQGTAHQMSLYAATKKSNEVMAHSYSHLFGLPTTGLRFFTVYGPWGRPDMALFKFTKAILADEPIDVFNRGEMTRDFTYIDDIVEGVVRVAAQPAAADPAWRADTANPDPSRSGIAPYRIFNIGGGTPVPLMTYINTLETCLGKKATLNLLPMQPGDVPATAADTTALREAVGYAPSTPVSVGIARFVEWYRAYFKV